MKMDQSGFMVYNPATGENTYCRNSQDAVDQKLSASLPCYSTMGKKICKNHYVFINLLTSEVEDAYFHDYDGLMKKKKR